MLPRLIAEVTPSAAIGLSDVQPIMDVVTSQITVGNVVGIIAGGVAMCMGFVFLFWGARKLSRMVMSAFKKGKLSV